MLTPEMPSPDAPERPSRASAIRFLFIDASMYYVDERGEHTGRVSESVDEQEERCRLATISNDVRWLRAAVGVGDELIDLARRSGSVDAWGCTSGGDSGRRLVKQAIKAATGSLAPNASSGPLARPEYGRWSIGQARRYDVEEVLKLRKQIGHVPGIAALAADAAEATERPAGMVDGKLNAPTTRVGHEDSPCVAIWHSGFVEDPAFFRRWCEAITAGPEPPVLILPDSPIMRDLTAPWIAGRRGRLAESRLGANASYVGTAAYVRTHVSAVVDVDGSEIRGDRFTAALAFLRARHQLRISLFDLLRDSLLAAQVDLVEIEREDSSWSPREVAKLGALRKRYDRPQRVHAWLEEARQSPPVDVFEPPRFAPMVGTHAAFQAAGVANCLSLATRALKTGEIAPLLYSPWPLATPTPDTPRERERAAARRARLVEWYRDLFDSAVRHDLIDAEWFKLREAWHTNAYRTYPGEPREYWGHIYNLEQALTSESYRRMLPSDGDLVEWYRGAFESAAQLGLIEPQDNRDLDGP